MSAVAFIFLLAVAAAAIAFGIAINGWVTARRRVWHVDCIYCGFHGTYRGIESLERGTTWHRQMCPEVRS